MALKQVDEHALLFHLAEDAFDVLNWARRLGMKRDKQLEEVVSAFQKRLAGAKIISMEEHERINN